VVNTTVRIVVITKTEATILFFIRGKLIKRIFAFRISKPTSNMLSNS
jgi:hypothetical protein